jgi:hypothetical protein
LFHRASPDRLSPREALDRFTREPLSVRNAAGVIVVATALVVVGAGVLIRFLDREEYPDVWIAIVTAVITSTFVGRATRESEAARAQDELSDRELLDRRFDELERKLDAIASAVGR